MFGLGWQEILVILVIAVLVIGPEQIPQLARNLGKLMAQFRRATNDLRDTLNREFTEHEEFKDFKEFGRSLDDEVRSIGYSAQEYVEREISKEEEELRKLEREVSESDAGAPAGTRPEATPALDSEEESVSVSATVPGPADEAEEPAPAGATDDEPPTERSSTRKETA